MSNTDIVVVQGKKFRKSSLSGISKSAALAMFKKAIVDDSIVEEAWNLSQPKKDEVKEPQEEALEKGNKK